MFEFLLQDLIGAANGIQVRRDGVAFLKVAKTLHPLTAISYLGFNISIGSARKRYAQCTYSDRWAKECVSLEPLDVLRIRGMGRALREPLDWSDLALTADGPDFLAHAGDIDASSQVFS